MQADFAPGRRVPVRAILGSLRRGAGDPTWLQTPAGIWRGCVTPGGPASIGFRVERTATGDRVIATGHGPGAAWMLNRLPALLGAEDRVEGFVPHHDVIAQAYRAHADWRLGRTGLVIDALVPAIIEQRVTGRQAFAGYRALVHRFGAIAPGPPGLRGLRTPPSADQWRRIPSCERLRAGVDAQRADTIMRALAVASRLEQAAELEPEAARRRLRSIPGIGVWTAAETAQRAFGDADAVSFGDYHVAKDIGYALTGSPVDDAALAELLKPYAGHRYRVQYLVNAAGLNRPRRGPRLSLPTHLPARF